MPTNLPADHIRLLFGLKLRQLRLDKGLSASDLAQRAGLSVSYITEIEKGRKYPKADKISALANALGVEYDSLVSLKLSKRLGPISDLLRSKFLTEIPLELFGIDPADLLELLAEAPAKISAMIRTFIDIAQTYNMSVERLYMTMLRSYQEMYDNYFPEWEAEAEAFLQQFGSVNQPITEALLSNLLKTRYHIQLAPLDVDAQPALAPLRSLFRPDSQTLYLNANLSASQRLYVLAREVGFQVLGLKVRPYTYAWVEADSFEQILNNYHASYFAGAILIQRDTLVARLTELFEKPKWSNDDFLALIADFGATPERFFYRLSNVLPSQFGIDQLFFYRFDHSIGLTSFQLTKEMHLSRTQGPRGMIDEHYCRRWIALTSLLELQFLQQNKGFTGALCRAQLSEYADTGQQYLIISVAQPVVVGHKNISVSMCFALNDTLRKRMAFLNQADNDIPHRIVNEACERCGIFDCRERVAAPTVLQKKRQHQELKKVIEQIR